jgi:phosphatidylglycerophosphatase A
MNMRFSADPKIILRDPVHFIAFGFGSGLSPVAPGTVGTLVAVPLVYALLLQLAPALYVACIACAFVAGTYICGASARKLEVHDHSGIVWDEFVGFAVSMFAMPPQWYWLLTGFLLFRFFDIIKPWPIREADHRLHSGLGIMLDDMIAGIFTAIVLHLIVLVF